MFKRTYYKKKYFKPTFKKNYRKSFKKYKRPSNKPGIHYFKRTFVKTYPVVQDFTHITESFKLSDLPGYQEFTAIFDQYKFGGIKAKIIYDKSSGLTLLAHGTPDTLAFHASLPNVYTVIDYNDSNSISSQGQYLEYQNCHINRMDKPTKRYFKPKVSYEITSGITSGYASTNKNPWVDSSYPDVKHYGFKMGIDGQPGNNLSGADVIMGEISVFYTVYLAFKNVK